MGYVSQEDMRMCLKAIEEIVGDSKGRRIKGCFEYWLGYKP